MKDDFPKPRSEFASTRHSARKSDHVVPAPCEMLRVLNSSSKVSLYPVRSSIVKSPQSSAPVAAAVLFWIAGETEIGAKNRFFRANSRSPQFEMQRNVQPLRA